MDEDDVGECYDDSNQMIVAEMQKIRVPVDPSGGGKGGKGEGAPGCPLSIPGLAQNSVCAREFGECCSSIVAAVRADLRKWSFKADGIDISCDDLKIMSDAILVENALAEVMKVYEGQDARREDAAKDLHRERTSLCSPSSEEMRNQDESQGRAGTNGQVEFNFSVPPKKGKKRGRPFDRDVRAPLLIDGMDPRRKEAIERSKQERDDARAACSLHSLRAKALREDLFERDQRPFRALKCFSSVLKPISYIASDQQGEPLEDGEVLLTIEIYDHVKRNVKTQEFIVRGGQPLTALKDRIYCVSDTLAKEGKLKLVSGYFLIGDVFYNDMRDRNAIDYSLPIRRWVRQRAAMATSWEGVGGLRKGTTMGRSKKSPQAYTAANMADVCFKDIPCVLGQPFQYCHVGACKHTIIIRDMRLAHPQDIQNTAAYPVPSFVRKLRHKKCAICGIYSAKKVTIGDRLAPEDPCLFCLPCYHLLHYSRGGELIRSDFIVHEYHHDFDPSGM